MIAAILPPGVIAVEAYDDSVPAPLFPAEQSLVERAVPRRRQEFATARRCAREALGQLGHPAAPLLRGERGAPVWPSDVVGSITHCSGYRAAAVAPRSTLVALGIDAERDQAVPDGVLERFARPEELTHLAALGGGVHWDQVLFCAKEAVYKAWFPLTGRWLGFEDASITFTPATGRFEARILIEAAVDGRPITGFRGEFLIDRGLIVTAVAVQNG